MSTKDPKVGEFMVFDDRTFGRYKGAEVVKVSPALVFHAPYNNDNLFQVKRDQLVFSGDLKIGENLLKELQASENDMNEERLQARMHHELRCSRLIEVANT